MQFLTSLFGGSENTILTALFALGIVIVLIVLGVWLLKVLFNSSANVSRARNRRMSVVETMVIDPKRQLMIIRRDNVEHLILTGGTQDLVIETGIPIAEASQQPARRPIPVVPPRRPVPKVEPPVQPSRPLRKTGLLRPVSEAENGASHKSDNSAAAGTDSAKENFRQHEGERPDFGDRDSESDRN